MDELTKLVIDGKRITLNELLDIIEGADDDDIPITGLDVAILPPVNYNNDNTDEDSGPEDAPIICNFPGSQLAAEATVSYRNEDLLNYSTSTSDLQCSPTENPPQTIETLDTLSCAPKSHRRRRQRSLSPSPNKGRSKRTKIFREYKWENKEIQIADDNEWPKMITCSQENGRTPLDYFRYFFDEEVLDLFVVYTNQYAAKRNILGNCNDNEMLVFIAILLLSGYVKVPRKHMYWQSNLDSHNPLVAGAMSRDRFKFIMSNIHVCNNDKLDKKDRFTKIRPLLNLLNQRFMDFIPHKENHSIDESMVPYFGSHGAKQFIRGKPIRFGMKFWCGGTSKGYLSWLEPYQGANTCNKKYAEKGLGYGVVMSYVDQLPQNIPYRLFFDNLFTGVDLLYDLKARNISATGTIRVNRIAKDCPLTMPDKFKNNERGVFEFSTDINSGICITRWNDNNIVSVATNFDSIYPLKNVNRFSRGKKKIIQIMQPKVINNYNQYMGAIDRADQNISLYRCGIRGKKWYFPIIAHFIDVCEQNAWYLYQKNEENIDHLAFRRRLACSILQSNQKVVSHHRGRRSKTALIDSRYDGIDHLICSLQTLQTGKKQQLACHMCSKKSTTKCIKCDVPIHVDCFINFHKK